MKALILFLIAMSSISVQAASCSQEAYDFTMENMAEKIRLRSEFKDGDISFDNSKAGQYKNGATLKNASGNELTYEVTIAGLATNEINNKGLFVVNRCIVTMVSSSCELRDFSCSKI